MLTRCGTFGIVINGNRWLCNDYASALLRNCTHCDFRTFIMGVILSFDLLLLGVYYHPSKCTERRNSAAQTSHNQASFTIIPRVNERNKKAGRRLYHVHNCPRFFLSLEGKLEMSSDAYRGNG